MLRRRIAAGTVAALGFLYQSLWALAQVSPRDAAKNLGGWKAKVPPALKGPPALIVGLSVLGLLLVLLVWPELRRIWGWLRSAWRVVRSLRVKVRVYRAGTVDPALAGVQSELEVAKTDLAAMSLQRQNAVRIARMRYEQLRYGGTLPEVEPLDPHTSAELVRSLNELLPYVVTLRSTALAWWEPFQRQAAGQPAWSAVASLAAKVDWCEANQMRHCVERFVEEVRTGREGRALLFPIYATYRNWRREALHIAECLGKHGTELPGYAEWRAAELKFLADFKRALAHPVLADARISVQNDEAHHGSLDNEPVHGPLGAQPTPKPSTLSISVPLS